MILDVHHFWPWELHPDSNPRRQIGKRTCYQLGQTACPTTTTSLVLISNLTLAYIVSLTAALCSQWGLRPLNVKYWCVTTHRNSCTNQLTGIHLSQTESFLSGHTSIYMVKLQISTRVVHRSSAIIPLAVGLPACTSLTREVFVIQSVRDGGQYSQSGYAFRKTSFSLETLTSTPNAGNCDGANFISSKLYPSIIMSHHAFHAWK